jgi:hypothetical protein
MLKELQNLKSKKLSDYDPAELVDISKIEIDQDKPVIERIITFIIQVKNPYIFRVGDTPVQVTFSDNSVSLQESLIKMFTKSI